MLQKGGIIVLIQEAYEKALTYFRSRNRDCIASVLDAGTHWIFYPGRPGQVEIGLEGIKIDKTSGIVEDFILPDDENFELLDRSVKVEL